MIAFLDFDGVVHGVHGDPFDGECMAQLEACLAEYDSRVVIISSWKDELPLDVLLLRLRQLGRRVVGACAEEPAFTRVPREQLVDQWLMENAYSGPWLALDDNPTWYGRHYERVLATTPKTGFTEDDVPRFHALVAAIRAGEQ